MPHTNCRWTVASSSTFNQLPQWLGHSQAFRASNSFMTSECSKMVDLRWIHVLRTWQQLVCCFYCKPMDVRIGMYLRNQIRNVIPNRRASVGYVPHQDRKYFCRPVTFQDFFPTVMSVVWSLYISFGAPENRLSVLNCLSVRAAQLLSYMPSHICLCSTRVTN